MNTASKQLCGIIGGMGPEATAYLFGLIIKMTDAKRDQDHIPFIGYNNPQIPDRTEHLLENGENPLPELVRSGKALKNAGATYIVMPCNTAYAYEEELEKEVGMPVINMIELTVKHIVEKYGKNVVVGLLATNGTIKTHLYQDALTMVAPGATTIVPDSLGQKNVMQAVYEIKGSKRGDIQRRALEHEAQVLIDKGAQVIIEGCTEIPLVMNPSLCPFPAVDPMEILAKEIIQQSRNMSF